MKICISFSVQYSNHSDVLTKREFFILCVCGVKSIVNSYKFTFCFGINSRESGNRGIRIQKNYQRISVKELPQENYTKIAFRRLRTIN